MSNSEKEDPTALAGFPENRKATLNVSDDDLSEDEYKRLLWKIDRNIIPYVSLLYLVSFLDRVNIGQARLAGLQKDLEINNNEYSIALTIFFVSYVAFVSLSTTSIQVSYLQY